MRRILTGERVLLFFLAALYVAPLWVFPYVPSADGPSHLANAVIIKDYGDPAAERFREYYVISRRLSPNLLYHLGLVGLLYVLPPLIAEKALLTLYVVLFAAAFRYLVIAVSGRPGPAAFLVFPFILSFSFSLGFFGWLISLALATWGVGYYWKRRGKLGFKAVVALNLLGVVIYCAHLLGWAIFVGSVAALALAEGVWLWTNKMREGAGKGGALRALWSRAVAAAYIAPAAALGVWYVATYPSEYPITHTSFPELARNLLRLEWLISFNVWQRAAAYATAAAFGIVVVSVISYKIYVTVICRSFKAPGAWAAKDTIWAAALAFAAFYFLCPWGGPAGGSLVSPRLAVLPFLVIAVWLSTIPGPVVRRALFVLAPALAAFHLFGLVLGYDKANRDLVEYNTGRPYVTEGATVLPVHFIYATGRDNKAAYMCNAASHYVLDNYAVNLLNYEADFEYFPVNWRHGAPVGEWEDESRGTPIYDAPRVHACADYLVCWKVNPFCVGMRPLVGSYDLIYSTTHLMVFKRRDV
ncbi:MAG TPA: hypothetical protein VMW93_04440 [bacterium]|nr:hypothetical protein [bacterium]